MMEFGKSLRSAREAKGYSVKQLAEMTRLAPRTIDELEAEDFSHIAAPIYGRGFIKLYCEAVGVEAKPFLDEFMEIISGNRDSDIRERAVTSVDAPPETETDASSETPPVATPCFNPPPVAAAPQPDLFGGDRPSESPAPETPEAPDEPALSRYATPIRTSSSFSLLSPVFWRMGILVSAALVFILLIVFGARALFRATEEKQPAPATGPRQVSPAAPRTPQKIPSLFIN